MVDRSTFVSGGRGFDSWLDGRLLTVVSTRRVNQRPQVIPRVIAKRKGVEAITDSDRGRSLKRTGQYCKPVWLL